MNCGSFPLSVKQLGWECFLTIRWLAVPRSVESPCLKWRTLSILVPCSRVREEWSKRLAGGLMHWSLCWSVVVKTALSQMAKLLIYCSVCVSTLTNGQKLLGHEWKNRLLETAWHSLQFRPPFMQMRVMSSAVYKEFGAAPPHWEAPVVVAWSFVSGAPWNMFITQIMHIYQVVLHSLTDLFGCACVQ